VSKGFPKLQPACWLGGPGKSPPVSAPGPSGQDRPRRSQLGLGLRGEQPPPRAGRDEATISDYELDIRDGDELLTTFVVLEPALPST
jgi:hypothetical protein